MSDALYLYADSEFLTRIRNKMGIVTRSMMRDLQDVEAIVWSSNAGGAYLSPRYDC